MPLERNSERPENFSKIFHTITALQKFLANANKAFCNWKWQIGSSIVLLTACELVFSQVQIQVAPGIFQPAPANGNEGSLESGVDLPRDPELNKRLDAAVDYLKEKDWAKAVTILQRLVETGEDVFIRVTPDLAKLLGEALPGMAVQGKDLSIRALAGKMISLLPKDAKDLYQAAYGQVAANQLKDAKDKGDLEQLSNVFRGFLHTDAGRQSAALLASYHLDRGDPLAAALCFDRLFQSDPKNEAPLPETIWLKGAVAMRLSGDKSGEEMVWKRMEERGLRELNVAGRKRSVQELRGQVASGGAAMLGNVLDWELVGGDFRRNAVSQGGVPFLESAWKIEPTVLERIFVPLPDRATIALPAPGGVNTRDKLAEVEKNLTQDKNLAIIPAQQPLALDIGTQDNRTSLAVYRSHGGLVARNLKTGTIHWANPIDWSMDRMAHGALLSKPKHRDALESWLGSFVSGNANGMSNNLNPSLLFENSTVGTISSDGQRVFTVVDFEIPPVFGFGGGFPGGPMEGPANAFARYGSDVLEAVVQNRIEAYHLTTGKLLWRLGGKDGAQGGELLESLFLGSPLPMGDRLFLLNEKQQELRLVTVDAASGRILGIQRLCTVRDRVQQDISRRTSATHLAYADGILVCPTNAGVVMGVELLTRSFVWAYSYRDLGESGNNLNQIPGMMPGNMPPGFPRRPVPGRIPNTGSSNNSTATGAWKSSPPRIADGRVVFTSPDSQSIVCLGLKDGALQWKSRREDDDLYLAGVRQGKVIVVGKKQVRALDLREGGKKVWGVDIGSPSGYASVAENTLYLPLRGTESSKQPEICVIDLVKGEILSHTRSRKALPVGNLVFHDGEMFSLSNDHVAAYPLLSAKLAQIDARIKANPNDPIGLMERGQMRLDKGDWMGAVEDLAKSVRSNPAPGVLSKARESLHEAFVEFFGRDFIKAEPFLADFESTCTMELPAQANAQIIEEVRREEKKRKAIYLRLLARGRESQGKVLEAFDTYLKIASLAVEADLDSVIEETGLRATPDVWARGRIAAMVSKADATSRAELEKRVSSRWTEMKSQNAPIVELRKFAQVFGSMLESGRSAQFELAKRLALDGSASGFLQAEQDLMNLQQFASSPSQAGEALVELAELYLAKGLSDDAAELYRLIAQKYADTQIRGRSGSEWLAQAWSDHRMIPFISGSSNWFSSGIVKALPVEPNSSNNPRYNQAVTLLPEGDVLPMFRRLKLSLQFNSGRSNYNQLRLVDAATGAEVLNEVLSRENLIGQPQAAQLVFGGSSNPLRLGYQARGHLVLIEAINAVHLIDALQKHESNRNELWNLNRHNPREGAGQTISQINSIQMPEKGTSGNLVQFQDGWKMRLGEATVLGGGVVAVLSRDGLMGLDPITGRKLWLREDVRGDSRIHGVGSNLLVVETDQDGKPKGTRLVRFADGVVIPGSDLASKYQKKLIIQGDILVYSGDSADGGLSIVGVDMNSNKEIWKVSAPAGSQFAEDQESSAVSWVEPDGKFRRLDAMTGREKMSSKVDPMHAQNAQARVLVDTEKCYLLLNKPSAPGAMVASNFNLGSGFQQLPANGELYAFDKATGKTAWRVNAKNQMLVTENFSQMPIVVFSSRYTKPGNGNTRQGVGAFLSIDKRSGKRLIDDERPNLQPFQSFKLDTKKGRIELEAPGARIVHQVTGPGGK